MKVSSFFALLFCLVTLRLQAQQKVVEKTISVPADNKVNLNFAFGNNIKITAWDKKEAHIKMTYAINGGRLNDALQLTFNAENGVARIDVKFDEKMLKTGRAEDCPDNQSGSRYYRDGMQVFTCHQINYEVFVPRNANLNVESVHCNIELIGLSGPVQAKSVHGFVDMNWPPKKGADFTFKSTHGDVFSDLDVKFSGEKDQRRVTGTLNGGGTHINLEAIHSNVYFRKQK